MPRNPVTTITNVHEYDTVVDIDLETLINTFIDLSASFLPGDTAFIGGVPYTVQNIPSVGIGVVFPVVQTPSGSGVYIGNGIVLTAAHVTADSFRVTTDPNLLGQLYFGLPIPGNVQFRTGIDGGLTLLEGFGAGAGEVQFAAYSAVPSDNFFSLGADSDGVGPRTSQDIAVIRTQAPTGVSGPANGMIIYSDPNEAQGALWTAGFPLGGFPGETGTLPNGERMFESTATLAQNSYGAGATVGLIGAPAGTVNNGWNTDLITTGGASGSGVWLAPTGITGLSGEYLAGVVSVASTTAVGVPIGTNVDLIGDAYTELANTLTTIFGTNFGSMFATNVLIGDQGAGASSLIQGTGFNENIYVSDMVGNTINGGGGYDTVYYTGISGGVTATINTANITVVRGAFNETLNAVEVVQGTAQADAFTIVGLAAGTPLMINGGSALISPQELPGTKNATIAEVLTPPSSGGRYLSAAQLAAASGVLFNHEDQDTVTIAQSLLDAGAQVTYYTAAGDGVIYLNGVQIGYTGIFHASELLAA